MSACPPPPYGQLTVRDGGLTGADGQRVSLAGVSFFWSQWMGEFFSEECVRYFAASFGATLVRVPLGVHATSGYLHDSAAESSKVFRVVDAAINNGLYAIIDWHSHEAHTQVDEAASFFRSAAEMYSGNEHVIYEIWNEPLDVPWPTIKAYAERIIAEIRSHDSKNLIVVGTPRWSQCVDEPVRAPLSDHNVAYALHFYAGTHGDDLRARAESAINAGLCLFVSEWGAVNADGDGAVAHTSVKKWMAFLCKHKLSHAAWSISNKAEGASFLKPHTTANPSQWTEDCFTESGCTIRDILRGWSGRVQRSQDLEFDHADDQANSVPVTAGALEIWWPDDGVKVDGVQPFKLVLRAHDGTIVDADSYEAWWLVDSGQKNQMSTGVTDTGCCYKIAECNVDGWNWRGWPGCFGPFVLTFEALLKQSGKTIAASRTIYAVR